jgi:hypothetical protein
MYQVLFKNRWFAALFAAMTLVSVVLLVGRDGQRSPVSRMADNLRARKEALEDPPKELPKLDESPSQAAVTPPEPEVEFIPDEELVDEGTGTDPSADQGDDMGSDEADDMEKSHDRAMIVSDDLNG